MNDGAPKIKVSENMLKHDMLESLEKMTKHDLVQAAVRSRIKGGAMRLPEPRRPAQPRELPASTDEYRHVLSNALSPEFAAAALLDFA